MNTLTNLLRGAVITLSSSLAYAQGTGMSISQILGDPCRKQGMSLIDMSNCSITGASSSLAARDNKDWKLRQGQVEFANNILRNTPLTFTEGDRNNPGKPVFWNNWEPSIDFVTNSGGEVQGWKAKIVYYKVF